jgi:hypothetical protein
MLFSRSSDLDKLIESVPDASSRDAALDGIVFAMKIRAPADAATRALEIHDSQLRLEALDGVMSFWCDRDPVRGSEWLKQATSLPADWVGKWTAKMTKSGAR